MFALSRILLGIAVTGSLFGCATTNIQQVNSTHSTLVVLGEHGKPFARMLTSDSKCPTIRFDSIEVAMDVRAAPESIPLRPTLSAPADSKPSVFKILTCEKLIPPNTKSVVIGDLSLPLPPAEIKRIVVIGDTGCRLKKSDHAYYSSKFIR